jgi:uncharacterized protein (DUF4213/DUF364 family)
MIMPIKTVDRLLDSIQTDAAVRQILMGAFWTSVVLDTDPPRSGLASTLRAAGHHGGFPVKEAGFLGQRSGRQLAELLRSDSTLEASIGMAAFNALLEVDDNQLVEANAEQIILERGSGGRVAIVGHFPFIKRVNAATAQCWVLELDPRAGDLPASQAAKVLPQADVVALTGTSLLNHTFDGLMALCRPDAFVLLLGPSAPLTPVLFEVGVNAISGTRVRDTERVLRSVSQGATFRQVKRAGGLRLFTWIQEDKEREVGNA